MPDLATLRRSFHAVRHLPPGRIGWRLLQRTRRRLPALLPELTHARLGRRARRLANASRAERVVALAREKRRQQALTDTHWRRDGGGRLEVTLLSRPGSLDPTSPVSAPAPAEAYLWSM